MKELKVKIGADLAGLQKGLVQASGMVAQSSGQIGAATNDVQKSFTVLNQTKFTFGNNFQTASAKLAQEAVKTSAVLGGSMKKGANEAGLALINLGRVAQDAPFGFIGIQNNLNPLLESFQQLKAQTGSTGAALKSMGQSLIGPAGLGLALSLVTAGIVYYQQWQQKSNKTTSDAKKTTDEYIASLTQLTQVQVKGAMAAQDELTNVRLLYSAYQDSTLPLKQRKEAYDQLQDQYPDYFKNIKFEQEASDKTTEAYNRLTTSILATARARAAQDLITKNSTRQLENEQKIKDLEIQKEKDLAAIKKASQRGTVVGGAGVVGVAGSSGLAIAESTKLKETQKLINDLKTDSNKLTEQNLQLEKAVTTEILKGGRLTGSVGNTSNRSSSPSASGAISEAVQPIEQLGITKVAEQFKFVSERMPEFKAKVTEFVDSWQEDMKRFSNTASEIATSGLNDLASGLGESIAGLASGSMSLKDVGNTILGVIGDIAIRLGKAAIAIGIGMQSIKAAFKNPFTAIAAGVALIAVGAMIKNASNITQGGEGGNDGPSQYAVPAFAGGVKNFRGGPALVGDNGPEIVNLPTGSDVIPNHKIGQMFGGGTQTIIPDVTIKGQDLLLVFNRANRDRS